MASSYTQSISVSGNQVDGNMEAILAYVVTCHTDGSMTNISTDTDSYRGKTYTRWIENLRLNMVEAFPTSGGTAPDAADVTVDDSDGLDLLNGNGVNLIHATDKKSTYPEIDGQPAVYPIRGALTIGVANQGTASANFTLRLTFVS